MSDNAPVIDKLVQRAFWSIREAALVISGLEEPNGKYIETSTAAGVQRVESLILRDARVHKPGQLLELLSIPPVSFRRLCEIAQSVTCYKRDQDVAGPRSAFEPLY